MATLNSNVVKAFPIALRTASGTTGKYTTEDNLAQIVRSSTIKDSYTIKYENGTLEFVIHGYYFKVSGVAPLPQKAYIVIDNNTSTLRNTTDGSTTLDDSNNKFTGLQFDDSEPSVTGCTTYELEISDNNGNLKNQLIGSTDLIEILGYIPYDSSNPENYTSNTGTVTSVRVQATSPLKSSVSSAQSSTLNTTISLEADYGDTQNPFGSKTKNYVLAAPTSSNGTPEFRKLVSDDIPSLNASKITSGTLDDDRIPNLSASKITSGTLPVARGGTGASSFTANRVIMSGTSTTGAFTTKAIDTTPTSNSDALITSGAVYSGLADKANSSHNHSAGNITSGTLPASRGGTGQTSLQATRNAMGLGNTTGALPVANGGTGATTFTSGAALVGSGTSAVTTRAIDTTSGGTSGSNSLITSGAVYSGLAGKANSSHSHSNYLPIAGGTMTGNLVAASSSSGFRCRNISFGTGDPSGGSVGDIYIKY